MALETQTLTYELNGHSFDAVVKHPTGGTGPRPAVLVCHAWGGRSAHEEAAAERLADWGYVGAAVDVFGVGVRGQSPAECEALITPLMQDREALQARLRAALTAVTGLEGVDETRVAAIGFCFGGLCALDLARANAPIKGGAAFHALLGATGTFGDEPIKPKVLALHGYDDPLADADAQRVFTDEMTARKADWQLHLYGGVSHAFTNEGANDPNLGLKHDPVAADRAWGSLKSFLTETIA